MKHAAMFLFAVLCLLLARPVPAAEPDPRNEAAAGRPFYFLGPHLFPFEDDIDGLIPADMDGDRRTDLIVLDARSSKFRLLLQKDGQDAATEPEGDEDDVNKLEPDRLLAKGELRFNEQIIAYTVSSFGGHDGAVACLTGDRELFVIRREEDDGRQDVQRFLLDLESTFCGGFECADLSGNGRDDLVVLAENELLIFFQDESGKLGEPRRYPVARAKSVDLHLADLDGDGRPDILYVAPATRYPLRVRLSEPDGSPGPEHRMRMPMPRDVTVGDCAGGPGAEVVMIESTTNRIKVMRWQTGADADADVAGLGALQIIPYARDKKARTRSYAAADVDADGLTDFIVTEPDAARLSLIRGRKGAGLATPESFPSLEEVSGVAAVAAPDGAWDIVLCSVKEGIVGVSRYDAASGRLEYPEPIDVGGKPHALTAGIGGHASRLYCIVRAPGDDDKDKGPVEVVSLERSPAGYSVARRQEVEELAVQTENLKALDADGDGLTDLLACPKYGAPVLLVQDGEGAFEAVSARPGFRSHLLKDLKPSMLATAPLGADGPVVAFLCGRNLVRAVRWEEGNLVVKGQFSSPNTRTAYVALHAADLDGDGATEILTVDKTSNWLSVLERDERGVYKVARNVEIGPFDFMGIERADVDGDGTAEVMLVGRERMGVLSLAGAGPRLVEVGSFESDREEARYSRVLVADLNADGRSDLLLCDVGGIRLEILERQDERGWRSAMRFKVFERRTFDYDYGSGRQAEPREIAAADVTGDGLTDLAIICHDRVIVYPQQGQPAPEGE